MTWNPERTIEGIAQAPERSRVGSLVFGWLSISGWCVFALYTISMMGLTHDIDAFATRSIRDYEANDGMDEAEAFEKDVQAAPLPRRLGLLGLIVVGAYCFVSAPSGVRVRNPTILASAAGLLGWATLSLTWSIDTSETTRELIRVVIYTAVAVAMARRFPAKEICLILIFSFLTSILVASVMDVVVGNFRPWQSLHRLQGSLHPNDLGRQALLVAVAAYAYMSVKSERTVWLIVCGLAIVILVLTKSRTSFISLFAGLLMVSMIRVRGYQAIAWLTTLLIIVSFAGLSWQLLSSEIRSSIAGGATLGRKDKAAALTGRFPLWEQALQQADNDLIRGSGFGAFWNNDRTKIMGEELEWFPRHAHSAYIEMIVNLGYIGLGILLVLVLSMLATSFFSSRQTGQVHYTVCTAIIVSEMVYGLTEAAPILPRDQGLFNVILMYALVFSHGTSEKPTEGQAAV